MDPGLEVEVEVEVEVETPLRRRASLRHFGEETGASKKRKEKEKE